MCAIAGIFGQKNNNETLLKIMLSMMPHRGPDFSNTMKFDEGFIGHNRLSIIDTHQRANQPMKSNDKRFVIVFNGEIYNYLELRNQLCSFYDFKTKGDTEIILAAFKKWGIESLNKFNGAFAFCIYDKEKKKAYFARDRFGQKPLFFWQRGDELYFSSEIKAFIGAGYVPQENLLVWHDYLINSDTDTSRDTFFKNIFQLLPGEVVIYEKNKKLNFKKWYDLEKRLKNNTIINKSEIYKSLARSVKLCSRADVPQAISLSGGLDSNILLSLYDNEKILDNLPKTFSVEFGKDFSEREFFTASNERFKNDNQIIDFTVDDFLKSIKPIIWHLESPSGGLMNCALSKVCHMIQKDGIKIVQDGTGLDEIFGGYEIHHLGYLHSLKNESEKSYSKALELFAKNWGYSLTESIQKVEDYQNSFSKTIDGYKINTVNVFTETFFNLKKINESHFLPLKNSMIDFMGRTKVPRNNRLKDRVSMAFSVELRLPFLDHELAELGLSLSNDSYFTNGYSKSILRDLVKNIVPEKIRTQKKMSIQSPQNEWLRNPKVKKYIDEIINSESFKSRNIFDYKKTINLWENFTNKKSKTSFFIWQIINMEEWFRIFIDNKNLKNNYQISFNN